MKIYGSPASPFSQRVLMAARLKGHELPCEPPPGDGSKSAEFLRISPLGRTPALDDDGWTLVESGAIAAYLDEVLEGAPLLPDNARDRARVRLVQALVDIELPALRPIMVGVVFGRATPEGVIEAARDQLARGLAALEQAREPAGRFACGDRPTLADCALYPMLTLLEIADGAAGTLAALQPHAGLVDYRGRMEAEPIVGRSAREMREGLAHVVEAGRHRR